MYKYFGKINTTEVAYKKSTNRDSVTVFFKKPDNKTLTVELPAGKIVNNDGFAVTEIASLMDFCRHNKDKFMLPKKSSDLEYTKSKKIEYVDEIRNRYTGCKVLVVHVDISDMQNLKGIAYAVSRSRSSFNALCTLKGKFDRRGITTMLLGSYKESMIGVQYIIEQGT